MKGFVNIGNTCYMNSGLQMLMNNKDLCNLILLYQDKSNILQLIGEFIREYHEGVNGTLMPRVIKMIVESKQHMFIGSSQHDAGEFVIFLLDIIDEEIKKYQENEEKTGLSKIFTIESLVRIKCKSISCLNINTHTESNNCLILDINQASKSLDCCYRLSKTSEKLIGNNLYYCEKCQSKTVGSKRSNVNKWPSNLVIWLKRFTQSGNSLVKNSQQLEIPFNWRHGYKLYGAVIHSGGLDGGHYTYIGNYIDRWYHFNDSQVNEISQDTAQHLANNAYILYYKQKN